jgi:uncharacterized protein YbaR (Trm112 family)
MIIACPLCDAKVDAKVIGQCEVPAGEKTWDRSLISLLSCPACESVLVAKQLENFEQYEKDWVEKWHMPKRVWPLPEADFSVNIPANIRESLAEADRCLRAGAYSACAVMCGRVLEGICKHYRLKAYNLADGLKALRAAGFVDERLFAWSEALRDARNFGAHDSSVTVTRDDASDLFSFAIAICDYVFVITARYEEYRRRRSAPEGDDLA